MTSLLLRAAGAAVALALFVGCGARTDLVDFGGTASGAGGSGSGGGSGGSPDGGCRPPPCPSGTRLDPASCVCVADACPNDAGEVVLASISREAAEGTAIVVRDGTVFWATRGGAHDEQGFVSRIPRCGGEPTTLASNLLGPSALATDGTRLFFGTIGNDDTGMLKGGLSVVPAAGGAVAELTPGSIFQGGIATDGHLVYWSGYDPTDGDTGIFAVQVAGGIIEAMLPHQIFGPIAIDADHLFLSQPASVPENSKLLVADRFGHHLHPIVDAGVTFPGTFAVDDDSVYYASNGSLMRVAKAGGAATPLTPAPFNALAVDATSVYWAQGDATRNIPNGIERVAKSGGAVTEISTSFGTVLAVDDAYVYWLRGGELIRLRK